MQILMDDKVGVINALLNQLTEVQAEYYLYINFNSKYPHHTIKAWITRHALMI